MRMLIKKTRMQKQRNWNFILKIFFFFFFFTEIGNEINAEFSRVVTEIETAIAERKDFPLQDDTTDRDVISRLRNDVEKDTIDCKLSSSIGNNNNNTNNNDDVQQSSSNVDESDSFDDKLDAREEDSDSPPTLPPREPRSGLFHPPPPPPPNRVPDPEYLQEEVMALRVENNALQEQIGRQELELIQLRSHIECINEDRDKVRRKVFSTQSHYTNTNIKSV